MKKKYIITKEEWSAIKEAIEKTLELWHYNSIEASDEDEHAISMSKETFFNGLKSKFIIEK
jgi:hypothetical protein